ncbi:helix-turn-helix transcriptional regulator [Oceanispirochaeta sp.]|jgi:DNA-binding CsgD family transcriptional regulator|uniref:helix-turn-helix transcriptional regulator n=1 Tax=Oceanispirochaeta sp. TaxID=2035350 RepID=UPI00261D0161|nr:helix-turn-helix transcriptional regulator [Oceanispirochaeta sp.]MDA3956645.1 helix-turn-helix transcriptional regulator [Oceanispirochaeta sp.]
MDSLYDSLYKMEIRKGEEEACRIRFLILGILMTGFFLYLQYGALLVSGCLFISNYFYLRRIVKEKKVLSPYILIFLEILLIGGTSLILKESDFQILLVCLYLIILYSASLRLRDSLILFSGILIILIMNLGFFLSLYKIRNNLNPHIMEWPGFKTQILLTLSVLLFSLAVLSRPHLIKRILSNQQLFFDRISSENYSLVESLDSFCTDYGLSERESEVLGILIRGKTYRMIAGELFISLDTVKSHIKSIYRKTAVRGKSELIIKLRNTALVRR